MTNEWWAVVAHGVVWCTQPCWGSSFVQVISVCLLSKGVSKWIRSVCLYLAWFIVDVHVQEQQWLAESGFCGDRMFCKWWFDPIQILHVAIIPWHLIMLFLVHPSSNDFLTIDINHKQYSNPLYDYPVLYSYVQYFVPCTTNTTSFPRICLTILEHQWSWLSMEISIKNIGLIST